ncbi:endonuclease reverse [Pyrrhoderma noxium]|uniref:Endonuclease reverse n=1 Tax=Pyrrhoderma noxium TaxID=2282107 RepID=A0A286UPL2_9AGAM|nr:endonuclease reverse [Pyrrhoderma noxium]
MNSHNKDYIICRQVNVARSPQDWEFLISSAQPPADFLIVQEPPWVKIGSQPSHNNPAGTLIWGLPNSGDYHSFLPPSTTPTEDDRPLVATLASKRFNLRDIQVHPELSLSKFLLSISVNFGAIHLFISNIYNPVHTPNIPPEVMPDLKLASYTATDTPHNWILAGDFNRHHWLWSPLNIPQLEREQGQADTLVDAISKLGLTILTEPGVTTRRGRKGQHNSTLDLILSSQGALDLILESPDPYFSPLLATDHAVSDWSLALNPREDQTSRIPKLQEDKTKDFEAALAINCRELGNRPIHNLSDLDKLALDLHQAILHAYKSTHNPPKKRAFKFDPKPWWNEQCRDLSAKLCAEDLSEQAALKLLAARKIAIRHAKRVWSNNFLEQASPDNIWHMAKMGRGIRRTPTPALKTGDTMANDNQSKAELFCSTFFPPSPLLPAIPQINPRQLIECPNITRGEIDSALKTTSNTSAPGPSGIGYHLLKTV